MGWDGLNFAGVQIQLEFSLYILSSNNLTTYVHLLEFGKSVHTGWLVGQVSARRGEQNSRLTSAMIACAYRMLPCALPSHGFLHILRRCRFRT